MTWESEAASDAGDGGGDEVVEVSVGWGGQFEGSEANVVQCFVVNDHDFVSIFDQLMDRERVALYGSTTVSETFGEGNTEKVHLKIYNLFLLKSIRSFSFIV